MTRTKFSVPDVEALMREWAQEQPGQLRMKPQERQLIEAFQKRFPVEDLPDLPLEQYTMGRGDKDNFCYWLERKTDGLGSIAGGTSKKFGVYWSVEHGDYRVNQMFKDAEDAKRRILSAVQAAVQALRAGDVAAADQATAAMGESRYTVRHKALYLYCPEALLPISNPYHVQHFLRTLGQTPQGDQAAMNRQLLDVLRPQGDALNIDNLGLGRFLYDVWPPPGYKKDPDGKKPDPKPTSGPGQLPLVSYLTEVAESTRNIILYGPPGTGKTFIAQAFAEAWVGEQAKPQVNQPPFIHLVTFHPSYSYEEFVEGLRPGPDGQGLVVRDGVFKRLCATARQDPENDYVLIIDEINRADTARTFGELITLLEDDKRVNAGEAPRFEVTLPYSETPANRLSVPENLYLIGTMNTADRSISLMDLALRRRFTFIEVVPDPALVSGTVEGLSLEQLLTVLNRGITSALDRDHAVGHAYLMADTMTERQLAFRWRHKVVPLLQEYFCARESELRELLAPTLADDASGIARLSDGELLVALRAFAGPDTR